MRNAPMRALSSQSNLVDNYNPALKEHRTVCFLAFGHYYMYRAVKRVLERQAARVLYRDEARQTLPPIQEWRPAHGRQQSPKVAISSPAQYCGLRLGGAQCEAQPGVLGPALGAQDFFEAAEGEREVPGAAERQKTLAAQDGKCALCGCGLTGTCELDRPEPQAASSGF